MRESDAALFPLATVGRVVQLFRQHLTSDGEADLSLLSIVAGAVEYSLTSRTSTPSAMLDSCTDDFEEPEVADISNLRLEPPITLEQVTSLYQKFATLIRGYCDMSLFKEGKFATRGLVKRISDIIWNTLSKERIKDRTHLSNLFSYLTEGKLDCFGVAFAVVAGCQVLGYTDVHLAMSEDHAWVVFGPNGKETAEVTWHEKKNDDRRGENVEGERLLDSWIYGGGCPVTCNRNMEVAALVSAISPAISTCLDSLEVGVLQQELLWLLHDLGHLDNYPMALGNLGDLEEASPTLGRPPCTDLYLQSIRVSEVRYGNRHIYPYLYSAGYYYRQRKWKRALADWAGAAGVLRNFKHSKEDEEIYKELMEINNELIPHIIKSEESVLLDPGVFGSLLQFYDGICCWEEESTTPVLHIGWVKPIVKTLFSFDCSVRSKVLVETEGATPEPLGSPSPSSSPSPYLASGRAGHGLLSPPCCAACYSNRRRSPVGPNRSNTPYSPISPSSVSVSSSSLLMTCTVSDNNNIGIHHPPYTPTHPKGCCTSPRCDDDYPDDLASNEDSCELYSSHSHHPSHNLSPHNHPLSGASCGHPPVPCYSPLLCDWEPGGRSWFETMNPDQLARFALLQSEEEGEDGVEEEEEVVEEKEGCPTAALDRLLETCGREVVQQDTLLGRRTAAGAGAQKPSSRSTLTNSGTPPTPTAVPLLLLPPLTINTHPQPPSPPTATSPPTTSPCPPPPSKPPIYFAEPEESSSSSSSPGKRPRTGGSNPGGVRVRLYSGKMRGLKDLFRAERMNSGTLHLQLTAQQSEVRRGGGGGGGGNGMISGGGGGGGGVKAGQPEERPAASVTRVKRARRE